MVKQVDVKQLVVFSILMEQGGGILDKAPDYIIEKFKACSVTDDVELLQGLLGPWCTPKFMKWRQTWGV